MQAVLIVEMKKRQWRCGGLSKEKQKNVWEEKMRENFKPFGKMVSEILKKKGG